MSETSAAHFDMAHAMEVARRVPDHLRVAALLHDAVEDGVATLGEIRETFGWVVASTVDVLTHKTQMTYAEYIAECCKLPHVATIKLADVEANLARIDEAHETLRPRYERARTLLAESLEGDVYDPTEDIAGSGLGVAPLGDRR